MPMFNFAAASKAKVAKKKSSDSTVYKIVEKDVIGVVHVTIDAKWHVRTDAKDYTIAKESYNSKDKCVVFKTILVNGRRWQWIRLRDKANKLNELLWLPFAVGCIVKGNILHSDKYGGVTVFKIKKVYIDYNDWAAIKAMRFYRDNIEVIETIIKQRIKDAFEE